MVFKMSYGANDVPAPAPAKLAVVKKAAPKRRTKPSLTDQAQALFEPPVAAEVTETDDAPHQPA